MKASRTYNIIFEGEHLKDHVQHADDARRREQIDVGVHEDTLELLELAAVPGRRHRAAARNLPSILSHALVEARVDAEFPVAQVVQLEMQRQRLDGRIEFGHVFAQLPERVDEQYRIVPAVLARRIAGPAGLEIDVLAHRGMHVGVGNVAGIRDHRDGAVGVIEGSNHRAFGPDVVRSVRGLVRRPQQLLRFDRLLLRDILCQRPDEMIRLRLVIGALGGIQSGPRQRHENMGPQGPVVLDLLRYSEAGIYLASVLPVIYSEVLLIDHQVPPRA